MTGLPRSWAEDEWVRIDIDGTVVMVLGISFEEYQDALDEATKSGKTAATDFCDLLEREYGAETEVVERAA